ncbi:sorbitol-specific phosphotransferase system component IIA [Bradyrhizobium sp. OAE829]
MRNDGGVRQINPTGKLVLIYGISVKPEIKNISVYQKENQEYVFGHPVLLRRASAVVTDVGRVAMDAGLR